MAFRRHIPSGGARSFHLGAIDEPQAGSTVLLIGKSAGHFSIAIFSSPGFMKVSTKQALASAINGFLDLVGAGFNVYKHKLDYLSAIKYHVIAPGSSKPIIFDVGAFRGDFALEMAQNIPNATIFCYEPNPSEYSTLVSAIQPIPSIFSFNTGLGDSPSVEQLIVNKGTASSSFLDADSQYKKEWDSDLLTPQTRLDINLVTGDDEFKRLGLESIDLLKIDAQGYEPKVLKGFSHTINAEAVKCIYLEVIVAPTYIGQASSSSLLQLLDSYGYRLVGIFNRLYSSSHCLLQFDALFTLL